MKNLQMQIIYCLNLTRNLSRIFKHFLFFLFRSPYSYEESVEFGPDEDAPPCDDIEQIPTLDFHFNPDTLQSGTSVQFLSENVINEATFRTNSDFDSIPEMHLPEMRVKSFQCELCVGCRLRSQMTARS